MNWDDLRFVVEIGRQGTLAAAAQRLAVDQTTVARRLRVVEKTLGTALFLRTDRSWRPTPVGIEVLKQARRVEADVAATIRSAERGSRHVSGLVRITAVSTIISDYLASHLPELYASYPDLTVNLIATDENLDISRREVDIAIRLGGGDRPGYLARKIAASAFGIYGPARNDMLVSAGDWLAYLENLDHTPEMRWLKRQLNGGRIRLRSNSLHALAHAAANGVGYAILPRFFAAAQPGLARIKGITPNVTRDLWLLIHRDDQRQARVKLVADWLAQRFSTDAPLFRGP